MYTRNKMHLLHQAHFTLIRTHLSVHVHAHLYVHETKNKMHLLLRHTYPYTYPYTRNKNKMHLQRFTTSIGKFTCCMSRAVSAGKYCVETVPSNHVPSNHVPITRWREKRKSDAFLCEPPSCQVSLATKYL